MADNWVSESRFKKNKNSAILNKVKMINFENIEVVEAYECSKDKGYPKKYWSVHIYIPDWGVDIRGVIAYKTKQWNIKIPHARPFVIEEKKPIGFPVIGFTSKEMEYKFLEQINKKTIDYIENKLKQ